MSRKEVNWENTRTECPSAKSSCSCSIRNSILGEPSCASGRSSREDRQIWRNFRMAVRAMMRACPVRATSTMVKVE